MEGRDDAQRRRFLLPLCQQRNVNPLYGFSRGSDAQDSGAQLSLVITPLPPCLSLYGNVLSKVSIFAAKRNQCMSEPIIFPLAFRV